MNKAKEKENSIPPYGITVSNNFLGNSKYKIEHLEKPEIYET